MIQDWVKQIPKDVIDSFDAHVPPVIFLGSGFGKEALPPLKTGGELANELRRELAIAEDGGEGLAELLQYYQNSMAGNRVAVISWLSDQLLHGKSKPGGAYRLLLELPCKEYLTTNYDSLVVDASKEIPNHHLRAIDDPKSYRSERVRLYKEDDRPILGRLHGSFDSQSQIVATTDDYVRVFAQDNQWRDILQEILGSNRVVFIGYSMRDFTTWTSYISMYVRWGGNQFPHAMIGPSSSPHVVTFWDKYGIKHISLTAKQFLLGLHFARKTFETKESVLFAAAAACMNMAYDDAVQELNNRQDRHKYPSLTLTAMKAILEGSQ